MSGRTLILFVIAIVIAGVTAMAVKNRISGSETGDANMVKVIAAISNISAGSFVRGDKDLAWIDWPKSNLNPTLISKDSGSKIEEFNGAVARRTILVGEPVVRNSLVRKSEGGFMSAVLSAGMRAVSIAVNATSGNAGFVFPGDRVDLILTHRIAVQDGGPASDVLASETFADNVRVLAVDQMLDNPENKAMLAKTLTLEVTPKQAEMINVATKLGVISVSLRSLANDDQAVGKVDRSNEYTRDTDVSRLLGSKGSVRARVNVIRGNDAQSVDFHQDPNGRMADRDDHQDDRVEAPAAGVMTPSDTAAPEESHPPEGVIPK